MPFPNVGCKTGSTVKDFVFAGELSFDSSRSSDRFVMLGTAPHSCRAPHEAGAVPVAWAGVQQRWAVCRMWMKA